MTGTLRYWVVDAFTRVAFRGNPAGVVLLDAPVGDDWMQRVAAEMNLSETAFVVRQAGGWGLRWFTPKVEVDLCGHATLASAHVLWESGYLRSDEGAEFSTRVSGRLVCRRDGEWVSMDFPARRAEATTAPAGLLDALGCTAEWVGKSVDDYLVRVRDAGVVRSLKPDQVGLGRLPVRGVIVTAPGDAAQAGYDFVSRFFAPRVGVAEDPVTGSAHCALAPYWAGVLGKTELRAWQASARGGEVRVSVRGDRVELRGEAVTVARGDLCQVAGAGD